MKTISVLSGLSAVRLSSDDVCPKTRPAQPFFVEKIQQRYSFGTLPDPISGQLIFQGGKADLSKNRPPVNFQQLQVLENADIVLSSNTDEADEIMDDFLKFLDTEFDYHIAGSAQQRSYVSYVVVEFDGSIKNVLSSLFSIEEVINKSLSLERRLESLSFGVDHSLILRGQTVSPLHQLENSPFTIARRANTKASENRFFCTAPLKTQEHLRVLEDLENVMAI